MLVVEMTDNVRSTADAGRRVFAAMPVPTLMPDLPIYETLRANLMREKNVNPRSSGQSGFCASPRRLTKQV